MKNEYENYQESSRNYDKTRVPVGVEILLECFASTPRLLQEQTILDAGCGTGIYIEALKGKVGRLYGLELNEGMLERARKKFKNEPTIWLHLGSILELPYERDTLDAMMCNQVLHHLGTEKSAQENFPQVRRLLVEAYRVLRPQGVLVISTSSHPQLHDGFWWADLIPAAVNRMSARFPTLKHLASMLEEAGFSFVGNIVPLDSVLQGEHYLDPEGPLNKSYRDGDSTWSLATKEELEQAFERLRKMNQDGIISNYLESRERLRHKIGQTTFVFARKQRETGLLHTCG
ncbi:MAG: class I SAM-dependent methyltransferase [Chloroflexi bacterium]|nr:class I SAM-dependent methyltransferase [Chloroflexota bacterium]